MINLLIKELKISTSILSYIFILFGLMFLIPGYPILCGTFFVTLGIFRSFEFLRENNDIIFSTLLPIRKIDFVNGKFIITSLIELCSFSLMFICSLLRMTVLKDLEIYEINALMNANFFALMMALVIFSTFNFFFVAMFFKTGYKVAWPFIIYIIISFLLIIFSEFIHYIPGCEIINSSGFNNIYFQSILLAIGVIIYLIVTILSYKLASKRFLKVDL